MPENLKTRLTNLLRAQRPSEADYQRQIEEIEAAGVIALCRECTQVLTATEIVFFEDRCERCEGEWAEEIAAWRRGESVSEARMAEFEAMATFGARKKESFH